MSENKSYRIEKGIPTPEGSEFDFPIYDLEVGDSFFVPLVPGGDLKNLRIAISEEVRKQYAFDKSFIAADVQGIRIWRTK